MKRGPKRFMPKESKHINLMITPEDYNFLETFGKETYRSISGSIRFAIDLMKKQYNDKGAKHGM